MRANEDALASGVAVSRHGVTTTKRLASLGITRRSVEALVRQQPLVRVGNGVLLRASWPDSSRTPHGDGLCRDGWRRDVPNGRVGVAVA